MSKSGFRQQFTDRYLPAGLLASVWTVLLVGAYAAGVGAGSLGAWPTTLFIFGLWVAGFGTARATGALAARPVQSGTKRSATVAVRTPDALAAASHEMKTPLNAVLGYAQLLRADPDHPLSAEQRESVTHIEAASRHLLAVIAQMIDYSRMTAGQMPLDIEIIAADRLVDEAISLTAPMAGQRQIQILNNVGAGALIPLRVDAIRIRQVLVNLLSNAVAYNVEGGSVTLYAQVLPDGFLHVEVTDTGPGIPADRHGELFQPFARLGRPTSLDGNCGTGLGLAVSREIVASHGGRIGYEARPIGGSCFWIDLPTMLQAGPNAPNLPARRAAGLLLYVTDDPIRIRAIERLIAGLPGWRLGTSEDTKAACDFIGQSGPSIVLLDGRVASKQGDPSLSRLRGQCRAIKVPLFVLIQPGAAATPRDAQFDGIVTEPVSTADLGTILAALPRAPDAKVAAELVNLSP